jgi:hypothetical protein
VLDTNSINNRTIFLQVCEWHKYDPLKQHSSTRKTSFTDTFPVLLGQGDWSGRVHDDDIAILVLET